MNNLEPWKIDTTNLYSHPKLKSVNEEIVSDYMLNAQKWCFNQNTNQIDNVKITYTAMHGVGRRMVERVFESFSLLPFIPVAEQVNPDPDFPTVAFPNPEEGEGALQLSMATADRSGSKVIIANDPDADRLALAEKVGDKWHIFNGNEIGILIAHWVFNQYTKHNQVDIKKLAVVNSTVSSKLLGSFAQKEGLYYQETLTGFKNIGGLAESLRNEGYTILFGFEEAIGYMIGDCPLDKDGVLAAAVVSEMAHSLYSQNSGFYSQLQEIYQKYGYFVTNNKYFFCHDPELQPIIFNGLRNDGIQKEVGRCSGIRVLTHKRIRDLGNPGYDSSTDDKKPILPTSSSGMITYYFENGAIVTLRGSGTEPKLKYYAELAGANYEDTKKTLDDMLKNIIELFIQPTKYGDKLVSPV